MQVSAGKIKVSQPEEEDELKIILKALYDVNLPKFIHDDIALFKVLFYQLNLFGPLHFTGRGGIRINAKGLIFSKDWLNRPHSRNTEEFDSWTFASELGGYRLGEPR